MESSGLSTWAVLHETSCGLENPQALVVLEKVPRIDGDAMSTHAKSWVERLESERLSGSCPDHLMGINPVRDTCIADLVDICDVDHAVAILIEFGHLCDFWLRDGHERLVYHRVQTEDVLRCRSRQSRDDLWNLLGRVRDSPGI